MEYVINMIAKPDKITTTQMNEKDTEKAMEVYLKNSFVSLTSVKRKHPKVCCTLFVNFDIDDKYKMLFKKENISIRFLEFGLHKIDDRFSWNICNYRYDVLKQLAEEIKKKDKVIMLDTDTVCTLPFNDLLEEMDDAVLMFDVQHARRHVHRLNIIENYKKIYNQDANLTHYGGEFIAGNGQYIRELYVACLDVLEKSKNIKNLINWNDEHITSIAIYNNLRAHVRNANAYIYRFWTGKFYLASTNYENNPVAIWHLPSEKSRGMIQVFHYLTQNAKLPSRKKMAKIFGFPVAKRPFSFNFYYRKILRRVKNLWACKNLFKNQL